MVLPKIMGILNVTPDSFYDGGRYIDFESAKMRLHSMISDGANIIDIGGESSRPGSLRISADEEMRRLKPIFDYIHQKEIYKEVEISVDTYKSSVARMSLERGATIINDITGLRYDKDMVYVARDFSAKIVIMHMKGMPENMQKNPYYDDVIQEIMDFFKERIDYALSVGIKESNIIIDPGIGFGKRVEDNLMILANVNRFKELGFPVLIGHSMKSFIGAVNNVDTKDRLIETMAILSLLIEMRIDIVRVHHINEAKRVINIINKILEFKEK